jgi:hypothetical protein
MGEIWWPAFREALWPLALLGHQVIEMADEPLALPQFRGWRCPRLRVMLDGKARHAGGIHAIILVALKFTLSEGFDACGIDDTDTVSRVVHIPRQVLTVCARSLP